MKRILSILFVAALVVAMSAGLALATPGQIAGTKHDLSAGNTTSGVEHSTSESEICIFCHTPHNARVAVPLWNRTASAKTYNVYTNPNAPLDGVQDTLTGASTNVSVLCLSCHDGSLSVGAFVNQGSTGTSPATFNATGGTQLDATGKIISRANLGGADGTDLTNDHPIGISYVVQGTNPDMHQANTIGPAVLFNSKVECASCHEVHSNTNAPFLRMSNAGSALCLKCHIK